MRSLPLGWRLILILCSFAAVILSIQVWNNAALRRDRERAAYADASTVLAIASSEMTRMTGGVENLLIGLAADAGDAVRDPHGCNRRLDAVIKGRFMGRLTLWVLDAQNRVICTTDPAFVMPPAARQASGEANVSRHATRGGVTAADGGHGPSLAFAAPWSATNGDSGSVLAVIDLRWLEDVYGHRPLPPLSEAAVVFGGRDILVSSPWHAPEPSPDHTADGAPEQTSGQTTGPTTGQTSQQAPAQLSADPGQSAPTGELLTWPDGIDRFTRASTADIGLAGVRVVAGIDREAAMAPFRSAERRTLWSAAVTLAACIGIAVCGVSFGVTRPLRRLAATANLIGSGARGVRVEPAGAPEIRSLANSMNRMAANLEEGEAAQAAARLRIEEADRSKTRFLAATSHDLRQPLQAATLFASLLQSQLEGTNASATCGRLEVALATVRSLLDNLLDSSLLESGSIKPVLEAFAIAGLLDELESAYAPVAATKGLALVVLSSSATVRSDRVLLGRMIRNLLENAIRYTDQGRVMLDAYVTGENTLTLEVRDTGIGIPEAEHRNIWEEFIQLRNPARSRNNGVGLGLSIVSKLSAVLDHPVGMQSKLGSGSSFTISVPLAERAPHPPQPLAMPHAPHTLPAGVRVLIVEDDDQAAAGMECVISAWDAACAVAPDGASGARIAAEFHPDVIISDYNLPDMTGAAALRNIWRTIGRRVPAVILTGEIGPQPGLDAEALGVQMLLKPITATRLASAIRGMLSDSAPPV